MHSPCMICFKGRDFISHGLAPFGEFDSLVKKLRFIDGLDLHDVVMVGRGKVGVSKGLLNGVLKVGHLGEEEDL